MTEWILAAIWAAGVGPAMWVILSVYVAMPHEPSASREARAVKDVKDAIGTALLWPAVAVITMIGVPIMAAHELMTHRALRLMGAEGLPDLRASEFAPLAPEKAIEVRSHPVPGVSGVVKFYDKDAVLAPFDRQLLEQKIKAQAGLPPMILGDGPEITLCHPANGGHAATPPASAPTVPAGSPATCSAARRPASDFCTVCGMPAGSLIHEEEHPDGI